MITVSILYPSRPGGRFDFDYYAGIHMPRSIALLSAHPGFVSVSVERGLAGGSPGAAPKYVAACFYRFKSIDDFLAAFSQVAQELRADMPNYTDIEPDIQFNELTIAG